MVKKSTRRSWALTAAVALFASVFGATPSQAAGEVTLAPSAGTSYTTLVTEVFTLDAALGVGVNTSFAEQLHYKVENAGGYSLSYTVSGNATATESGVTSTSFVVDASAMPLTASSIAIELDDAGTTSSSVNIVVTAFVDADNDNVLDSGEWQQARTVTFMKYSEATATVAISTLYEADTTITATGAGFNFNTSQLDGNITVQFVKNGSNDGTAKNVSATYVATTSSAAVAAADTYSAKLIYNSVTLATAATANSVDRTISTVSASVVAGDNALVASVGQGTARINRAFDVMVMTATSSSGAVAVGNISGTWKVETSATLSSTVTLNIGGVTYTSKSDLPTSSAFSTGADGKLTLGVTPTGFTASDRITFSFTAQNWTRTLGVGMAEATYTLKAVDGQYAYAPTGGSVVLSYTLTDQFKVLSSRTDERVEVSFAGTGFSMDTVYANLVGGKASVTATGAPSTKSGDVLASANVERQNASTLNWASAGHTTTSTAVTISYTGTALSFSGAVAATSNVSISNHASISGALTLEGGSVTITGTGLEFKDGEGNTASDAITVRTGANGLFTVSAYSNVAGKYALDLTAGAATLTASITVDAVADTAGEKLSIEQVGGGDYVAAGSTLRVTVTLTDTYSNAVKADDAGNNVALSVAVEGAGFWSTLPSKTDADGKLTFNVLVGASDTGTIKVSATYSGSKAVTASKTFTIGSAPAETSDAKVTLGTFQGYAALFVAGADGSKLSVKFAGKWYVVPSIDSGTKGYFLWKRNTGAGYPANVTVYIDGKPVDIKVNGEMVGTTASIVTK